MTDNKTGRAAGDAAKTVRLANFAADLSIISDHRFRSHPRAKILDACANDSGVHVFYLDTGNADSDDVLLGATRNEVLADVLAHHEIERLPDGWTLKKIWNPY